MANKLEIRTIELAELIPNPENYRTHPPEQVDAIARSLTRLGQYTPVVATPDMKILCGHGTVLAAQSIGWDTLEVSIFTGTEEEELQLMVADNELSRMSDDDGHRLAELLARIEDTTGMIIETGWTSAELKDLQDQLADPFSPELVPKINIREYTQDQVDAVRAKMDERFKAERALDHIVCPACGEEFYVDHD